MAFDWIHAENPLIIYIADPMCSWCYGMAPTISEIKSAYPDHEFKMVMGGLRPGGTDTMASMGEFLAEHWKEVNHRTGQPFNFEIVGNENFVINTEPGSRTVVVARKLGVTDELSFFHDVQKAFFVNNKQMTDISTFAEIAEKHGLNVEDFRSAFESDEMKYETRADFQLSAEMGVTGFPSVVLRHKKQLFLAANGYRNFEDLNDVFKRIQSEE